MIEKKTKKQDLALTRHSWWNLDELAVEVLNDGLALLRGLHSGEKEATLELVMNFNLLVTFAKWTF